MRAAFALLDHAGGTSLAGWQARPRAAAVNAGECHLRPDADPVRDESFLNGGVMRTAVQLYRQSRPAIVLVEGTAHT